MSDGFDPSPLAPETWPMGWTHVPPGPDSRLAHLELLEQWGRALGRGDDAEVERLVHESRYGRVAPRLASTDPLDPDEP